MEANDNVEFYAFPIGYPELVLLFGTDDERLAELGMRFDEPCITASELIDNYTFPDGTPITEKNINEMYEGLKTFQIIPIKNGNQESSD